MAVERVFADVNVASVMTTAHATAVALLTATKRGIPVVFHTPTEVKAAVTGSGRADKAQVTAMVTRILGLEVAPKPADAADALALAICHAWRGAAGRPARRPGRPRPRRAGPPVIASVRGPVAHVGLDHVVVEVGGVGMLVHTTPGHGRPAAAGAARRRWRPPSSSARTPSPSTASPPPAERDMFETVQTVSGVGPRLALAMLSVHGPRRSSPWRCPRATPRP